MTISVSVNSRSKCPSWNENSLGKVLTALKPTAIWSHLYSRRMPFAERSYCSWIWLGQTNILDRFQITRLSWTWKFTKETIKYAETYWRTKQEHVYRMQLMNRTPAALDCKLSFIPPKPLTLRIWVEVRPLPEFYFTKNWRRKSVEHYLSLPKYCRAGREAEISSTLIVEHFRNFPTEYHTFSESLDVWLWPVMAGSLFCPRNSLF